MKKTIRISTTLFLIVLVFSTYSCKKDKALLPVLTTTVITANSITSATSGGIITSDVVLQLQRVEFAGVQRLILQ